MKLIKLDATESTNTFLRQLSVREHLDDFTVVMANHQLAGKGQMGSVWQSEKGKNLTVSVFKRVECVALHEQFYVSMAVSLAILKALSRFQIQQLHIKWPNDILSANQKICGILIENIVVKDKVQASIIGIGLNVNQTQFEGLPSATSMKNINGITYPLEEVLQAIIAELRIYASLIEKGQYRLLKTTYEGLLFRKDKPSTFEDPQGRLFMGFIQGVSPQGKLQLLLEDEVQQEYDLKEVKLLY